MADTFGTQLAGKCLSGDGFYATPAADVGAGAIFMPAYSTSPQFGISSRPVKSGDEGFFETRGVFAFAKPDGWTSSAGKAVYWAPTAAATGALSASSAAGSVLIGFEVVRSGNASTLIYVDLVCPTALQAS